MARNARRARPCRKRPHASRPAEEVTRLREALSESERSSRLLVDSIPGLVALLTPAGEVQVVNRQILEYTDRRWRS